MNLSTVNDLSTCTLDVLERLGDIISKSRVFPSASTKERATTQLLVGQSLGLTMLQALNDLVVTAKGIELKATLMASLIRKSRKYDYHVESLTDEGCTIVFLSVAEDAEKIPLGSISFTKADSVRARLASKDTYIQYGRDMYFSRALSSGFKKYCPDAIGSAVYATGELPDETPPTLKLVEGGNADNVVQLPASSTETPAAEASPSENDQQREALANAIRTTVERRNIPIDRYGKQLARLFGSTVTLDTLETLDVDTLTKLLEHTKTVKIRQRAGEPEQSARPSRETEPAKEQQLDAIRNLARQRQLNDEQLNAFIGNAIGAETTLATLTRPQAATLIGIFQKRSA